MQPAVSDLYKIGVKLFVAEPAAVELRACIPVFHRWIQQQKIAGHLLLDVHDYSHVPQGPGILLVAHEGNFSLDQTGGQLGLLYYRKQPLPGDFAARLGSVVQTAWQAGALLEAEPSLGGIKFKTGEMLLLANDRLLAPNTPEATAQFQERLRLALGAKAVLTNAATDSRDRLAIHVRNG